MRYLNSTKPREGGFDMYYLACCGSDGRCFGFLKKDRTVSKDPDKEMDKLMSFKKKADASEIILQINLGHALLPGGAPYRLAAVKG